MDDDRKKKQNKTPLANLQAMQLQDLDYFEDKNLPYDINSRNFLEKS